LKVVIPPKAGLVESRHPAEGREPWPTLSEFTPGLQESVILRRAWTEAV